MAGFQYFPQTTEDIRAMLDRIGVKSLDDLYADVPADCLYKGEYDLPDAMTEQQVREFFEGLATKNPKLKVFAGAGAYDHYTPAVIPYITQRSEFITAYTPYQCEISQGTLRYIFEYQSMICTLTGMDVSNASMYDGPTAAAEAMRMMVVLYIIQLAALSKGTRPRKDSRNGVGRSLFTVQMLVIMPLDRAVCGLIFIHT